MLRVRARTARPIPPEAVGTVSRVNVYDHIEFAVFPGAAHALVIQITRLTSRAVSRCVRLLLPLCVPTCAAVCRRVPTCGDVC